MKNSDSGRLQIRISNLTKTHSQKTSQAQITNDKHIPPRPRNVPNLGITQHTRNSQKHPQAPRSAGMRALPISPSATNKKLGILKGVSTAPQSRDFDPHHIVLVFAASSTQPSPETIILISHIALPSPSANSFHFTPDTSLPSSPISQSALFPSPREKRKIRDRVKSGEVSKYPSAI